ncbi:MAG: hypothetical protein JWQ49_6687 [Edaphobacter sp.]|nr:hypothetical protein [Edaphobacter sp.]
MAPRVATIVQLRQLIFWIWMGFALALIVLPLPLLRNPQSADANTYFRLLKALTGLWLPAISCFSGLWFAQTQDRDGGPLRAGILAATLSITFLYFGLCLALVSVTLFVQNYGVDPSTNEALRPTMDEQLGSVISWLQLISPIFLAPIGFLTGKSPKNIRPRRTNSRSARAV